MAATTPTCLCPTEASGARIQLTKERSRAYYLANKERIKATVREYRLANKDKIAARNKANIERIRIQYRAWYAANKDDQNAKRKAQYPQERERILQRCMRWSKANRTAVRKIAKRWRDKNRELANARSAAVRKANPEKYRAIVAAAVARRKSRIHPEMDYAVESEFFATSQTLSRQSGELHHVDHIIPLAAGGWHHHLNMQVLPATINLSKNDDPFWEHPSYKSWRDVPEYLWPEKLVPIYRQRLQTAA